MGDRELLELAAKAAGLRIKSTLLDASDEFEGFRVGSGKESLRWNALADDGDALRLAVKLGLSINICRSYTTIYADLPDRDFLVDECTRRAIVRAAAEIGRAMP